MNRRAARFLTRWYPPAWRARFGEEFQAFLEARRVSPAEALNVAVCALSERFFGAVPLIGYACVLALSAAGALFLANDQHPAQTIGAHRTLWLVWATIELIALVAFALLVATVVPAVLTAMRTRIRTHPFHVLITSVLPACAVVFQLFWHDEFSPGDYRGRVGFALFILGGGFLERTARTALQCTVGRSRLLVLTSSSSIVILPLAVGGFAPWMNSDRHMSTYFYWPFLLVGLFSYAAPAVRSVRRLLAEPAESS